MTDFGADNTGTSDARAGIQLAMNSCDSTAGCDVYFPAGTYQLNTPPPGSTSVLTIPAGVPITLSGAGQGSSVLQPTGAAVSGTYDILSVAAGSTGFSMHDLGMTFAAIPLSGAAIRIPSAIALSLLNLRIVGAYDDIALGQVGATAAQTLYTNIRGVNALNTNHCFLRLDGGVLDTYVRGSYALANAVTDSQIVCSPSTQGLGAFGVQGLYLSDSTFSGFTRGLSFAANVTQFSDFHFDDLYLDVASNGPAFELFVPLGGTSTVQNISMTNSTLQSAGTACVVHGAASAVKLRNVECNGGIAAPLPSACSMSSPRGFALVEVSGTGGSTSQTISLTVTPPVGGMPVTASVTTSLGESAAAIASALGQQINTTTLVTNPCPLLVPVQTFNDVAGPASSIGQELEVYSYRYSNSAGATPTVSVSNGGGTSVSITMPNVTATFAPADAIYVGAPPTVAAPSSISVAASHASMAQNGAGLHLQGGSAMSFSGNTFGDPVTPNQYAVQVDSSGVTYSSVALQSNSLANASSATAVHFSSGGASGLGPAIEFDGNTGYNPTGQQAGAIACSTATTNPFPFPIEVYIAGLFSTIAKNGTVIYTGSLTIPENAVILLGANEKITITCSGTAPAVWFGQ